MSSTPILTGLAASKGEVEGIVRIIKGVKDIAKVKEGDILVTEMTTPELISAMVRAGGYITDIGGLTCHAAVVAREYQKPCVVGTLILTRTTSVLKQVWPFSFSNLWSKKSFMICFLLSLCLCRNFG